MMAGVVYSLGRVSVGLLLSVLLPLVPVCKWCNRVLRTCPLFPALLAWNASLLVQDCRSCIAIACFASRMERIRLDNCVLPVYYLARIQVYKRSY